MKKLKKFTYQGKPYTAVSKDALRRTLKIGYCNAKEIKKIKEKE